MQASQSAGSSEPAADVLPAGQSVHVEHHHARLAGHAICWVEQCQQGDCAHGGRAHPVGERLCTTAGIMTCQSVKGEGASAKRFPVQNRKPKVMFTLSHFTEPMFERVCAYALCVSRSSALRFIAHLTSLWGQGLAGRSSAFRAPCAPAPSSKVDHIESRGLCQSLNVHTFQVCEWPMLA